VERRTLRNAIAVAALSLAVLSLGGTAFAAGGTIKLVTDNGPDGYYYALSGSGSDRFITEYRDTDFDPGAIICGARVRELNQGTPVLTGTMGGDLRAEDPANPGYPDLTPVGLIAVVDPTSQGSCSTSSATPRNFTFGGGAGITSPAVARLYMSAIEPQHGAGPLDFCGVMIDTSSAPQGRSKVYSAGTFGAVPFNHFVEISVFEPKIVDLNIEASGSKRFPGDRGIPVVFTTRPNASGGVTDDNITLHVVVDNNTGAPVSRRLDICADQSVINPKKGLKAITGFFAPKILNPVSFPVGRTVLNLAVSSNSVKAKAATIVNAKTAINLPLVVDLDNGGTDPCHLEGSVSSGIDDERQIIGLRRRAGRHDDNSADAFFLAQATTAPGDSLNERHKAVDLPKVSYVVSGLQVVGGEFGGTGLPGFDAVELRQEDAVFGGSPDLTTSGLLRSCGTRDGAGSVPTGPAPTTVNCNVPDISLDATSPDIFVLAVLLPGDSTSGAATGVGADLSPGDTILDDASVTISGQQPASSFVIGNFMLGALLNGDFGTLPQDRETGTLAPGVMLREPGKMIAIMRDGRRIE
jgi:hypothetical protein